METAIQLYTLRDLDEPLTETIARVAEVGFDGVEFAGSPENPVAVADALDDHGLSAAGAHVGYAELRDDLAGAIDVAETVGYDTLVVPYLDETYFDTEGAVTDTAGVLSELADQLADGEHTLAYHNHDHEFVSLGDRDAFDALVAHSDDAVAFEVDAGWVTAAGRDPAELIRSLGSRVPLVHLKDCDGTTPVELGEGDLVIDETVAAAEEVGSDWLVYEHDHPDDPVASLEHGADVLAHHVR